MTTKELKAWRERNGYSQSQLAEVLKVAPLTISRWELGTRSIPSFLHLALECLEMKGGAKPERAKRTRTRKETS